MEEDRLEVSKDLLKTVSADTRVDILKALEKRPMTASELSRRLTRHVTTIAEHMEMLRGSNLVERVERPGRKWVYYKLTKDGKKVLHPESYKWVMVISILFIVVASSLFVWNVDALPGDFLYPLKRARESLMLSLPSDSVGRASTHLAMAEERLREAKAISLRSGGEDVDAVLVDYEKQLAETERYLDEAKRNKMDVSQVLTTISESVPKHIAIVSNLMEKPAVLEAKAERAVASDAGEGKPGHILKILRNMTDLDAVCGALAD